jgi:8-oxo-dGTP pyrophosphatase MutT (NUDIX family)
VQRSELRGQRHPLLERLSANLTAHPGALAATDGEPRRAAVAIIFRVVGDVLELLLIQRAEHEGDPWSGHIALPGGRHEAQDATLQDTVVRETFEETAIDLSRDAAILGVLDELRPRTPVLPAIIVTPFVAVVRGDIEITLSNEVAEAFWVPWSLLSDPAASRESTVNTRGTEWRVPSYVIGSHIVWGMTERMLHELVERIGA